MKRLLSMLGAASLVTIFTFSGNAAGRFDQKLLVDKQAVHVLNRLTFGPRPGDMQQVRLLGADKWIDQQLHPERIAENPLLESKLKALETIQLPLWQIMEKYGQPQGIQLQPVSQIVMKSLTPQVQAKLRNGSAEERLNILASLGPFEREKVLAASASNPMMLEGLPDNVKQEAMKARQAEQEELQKERIRLMPPLSELLTPEQMRTARQGTRQEKLSLINSLDPPKRQQVLRALGPAPFNEIPELRREVMMTTQPQQLVNSELIENKLYRAIYSNRQLEEVLVDFWMNHFNIYNGKGQDRIYLTAFERDAIRPYLFGHFKDMLLATARHPAMLFYLDNFQSQVPRDDQPNQPPPGAQRPGLNENYGRELMELHTLGVDGGYAQQDVIAVARAFSGWTIYDLQKYAEFQFNPAGHDRKEKIVLGHTLPAGRGEQDGLDIINILAHHPSTAKFISKKLAQRFVADDPPQALVDRMAATFTKTDGDLRAVLQTMFSSVEFMSEGALQAKLKSPLEMVVSALRVLNADVIDTFALAQRVADLGQPLYGKVEPTGYPNTADGWTNTAGVLGRINFSTVLSAGQIPGIKIDMSRFNFKDPATVASDILGGAPSPQTLAAIEKGLKDKEATPSLLTNLVLSSPDFQRR